MCFPRLCVLGVSLFAVVVFLLGGEVCVFGVVWVCLCVLFICVCVPSKCVWFDVLCCFVVFVFPRLFVMCMSVCFGGGVLRFLYG